MDSSIENFESASVILRELRLILQRVCWQALIF